MLIAVQLLPAQQRVDFRKRISAIQRNPNIRIVELTDHKEAQNNSIPVLILTKAKEHGKQPAVCVIAGTDARLPYTTEMVLTIAERYASATPDDSVWRNLEDKTLYLLPQVSPSAIARFNKTLSDGKDCNDSPFDDDKDGKTDEDPVDDLNNDGIISYIRVLDSTGNFRQSLTDPRVMIPVTSNAEQEKQNINSLKYKLFMEGFDNDGDGLLNEDGLGGTSFNRNFTYDYKWFKPYSGKEPFSEIETKAIADFLTQNTNIQVMFILGANNNLSKGWEFNAATSNATVVTSPKEKDAKLFNRLSELYIKMIPHAKEQKDTTTMGGDILRWGYYHIGRWSLGTPAWWLPEDTTISKMKHIDEIERRAISMMKWREKNGLSLPLQWQPIAHPDFPNHKVEVGGFPAAMSWSLPANDMDSMAHKHQKYVNVLLNHLPRIAIHNLKIIDRGSDVYEISLEVKNEGLLPTCPQIAESFTYVPLIAYDLYMPSSCTLIAGNTHKTLPIIAPQESKKISWTIQGKGNLTFNVGAPNTGFRERKIELK